MRLNAVIPAGLQLKLAGKTRVLYPNGDGHYRAEHADTGRVEIITYNEALSWLRRPDCSSLGRLESSSAAARVRNGGRHYREQLSDELQDQIDFRKALCVGVDHLEQAGIKVTPTSVDKPHNQKIIREVAGQIYKARPISYALRGGSTKMVAIPPKGKILLQYRERYIESDYDEIALADQSWLRGNRKPRIPTRMRELMTEATEKIYLDLKNRMCRQLFVIWKLLRWKKTRSGASTG